MMLLTLCSEVYCEGGICGGDMFGIGCRRWVVLCSWISWGICFKVLSASEKVFVKSFR